MSDETKEIEVETPKRQRGPTKPRPWSKRLVLLLTCVCLEALCEGMLGQMLTPILPKYAKELKASDLYVDTLFALFPLAVLLSSSACGWLSGRIGRTAMMYFGIILSGACTIVFGMTKNLAVLGVTRFLQGVGSAATWSATYALLADYFPSRKTMVIGLTETATGLGGLAGPVLAAFLAASYGFAFPFYIVGGLLLGPLIGLWFLLRKKKKNKHHKHKHLQHSEAATPFLSGEKPPYEEYAEVVDGDNVPLSTRGDLEHGEHEDDEDLVEVPAGPWSWGQLLNPILVTCSLAILMIEASTTGLAPKVEEYMNHHFDLSESQIGLVLAATSIAYTITAPLVSVISRKLGAITTIITGLVLITMSLVLMGPMPGISFGESLAVRRAVLVVSFALSGFGTALSFVPTLPLMLQSVYHLGPEATGLVSGSFYAIFSVGQTIGPFIGGFIYKYLDFGWTSALLGAMTLVFAPFMFCMRAYLAKEGEEAVQEALEETAEEVDNAQNTEAEEEERGSVSSPLSPSAVKSDGEEEEVYEEGWEQGYDRGWVKGYKEGVKKARFEVRTGHLPHSLTLTPARSRGISLPNAVALPVMAHQTRAVNELGPATVTRAHRVGST